jgi:predicted Mrr-cat superfamily restriction endonuclease
MSQPTVSNVLRRPTNAFILRQSPSSVNVFETISLPENVVVNGWSEANGLLVEKDYWAFRDILRRTYYSGEKSMRRAGHAAATMWRFIHEMKIGDWTVVPHWAGTFYIAEITGDPFYEESATVTDSAYRRKVRWLNDKQPIPRKLAKSRLISRMKTQQTSAKADDIIDEIVDAFTIASDQIIGGETSNQIRLFEKNLRIKTIEAVLAEIHNGYMEDYAFEHLVKRVLLCKGATNADIVPRLHDKGVDILATFLVGGVAELVVGVQVKHHKGITANRWIDQLLSGLEAENLTNGWFVTSGNLDENVEEYLEGRLAGTNLQVFLVDGEQFAGMIVDGGLEILSAKTG